MKLHVICVGKLTEAWQRTAAEDYVSRLQRYFPTAIIEMKEEKGGKKGDSATLVRREGERILAKVPEHSFVIVLDERGKNPGSEQLAEMLNREMVQGGRDWTLIIGGPYGLSADVRNRADYLLGLSRMTFTHQMARIFLLEQLYRCCTIIKNEPYHNR